MSEVSDVSAAPEVSPATEAAPEVVADGVEIDPSTVDLAAMGDRLVEVTIDGEAVMMPLSEVVANTQRAKASHKRFLEAAELRKKVDQKEGDIRQFINALRGENPEQLLHHLGIDTSAMVERELRRMTKLESMTPQERMQHEMQSERQKLRREKDKWEGQKQAHEDKKVSEQVAVQAAHYQEQYTKDFTEALGEVGIAPKSGAYPKMLEYMAQIASEGLDAGVSLKPADLVQMAREEYMGLIQGFLGNMEGEKLHNYLGEGVSKKFRQYDIERVKGKLESREGSSQPSRRRQKKQDKKAYNMDEMRELFKSRRMKG